jgi:hypothetical protein
MRFHLLQVEVDAPQRLGAFVVALRLAKLLHGTHLGVPEQCTEQDGDHGGKERHSPQPPVQAGPFFFNHVYDGNPDPDSGVEYDLLLMNESFRLQGSLLCGEQDEAGTPVTWGVVK